MRSVWAAAFGITFLASGIGFAGEDRKEQQKNEQGVAEPYTEKARESRRQSDETVYDESAHGGSGREESVTTEGETWDTQSEPRGDEPKIPEGQSGTGGSGAQKTLDVEELNDNLSRYRNQSVKVAGEVQDKLGPRAFVIESGGVFDDEITVIVPKNATGLRADAVGDDASVVVTGKVRTADRYEIEREFGWDLTPELEVEFEGRKNFLIADSVERQRK